MFYNMTAERCAELSLVAIANRFSEVWVSKQYYLFLIYVDKFAPHTLNTIATAIMSRPLLDRVRNLIMKDKKVN